MADKFEDLRTYTAVVACGGINAAAAQLGIAKSAVSRRISDLETRLGVTLIERTTRRFELTAVGREYHARALDLLSALERLDADPSGLSATEEISLRAPHEVLTHLIAPALADFRNGRHGVTLLLATGRGADLTISSRPAEGGSSIKIASHGWVVCASPAHVAKAAGENSGIEIFEGDGGRDSRAEGGGLASRPRPGEILAPDANVAFALAVAGAGVARLPDFLARDAIKDGRLVAVGPADRGARTDVVANFGPDASTSVLSLVDHLAATLQAPR